MKNDEMIFDCDLITSDNIMKAVWLGVSFFAVKGRTVYKLYNEM